MIEHMFFALLAASMRPRVFPAENHTARAANTRDLAGFNEAAGIPRGKRQREVGTERHIVASMRPRVFPAENMANTHELTVDYMLQ